MPFLGLSAVQSHAVNCTDLQAPTRKDCFTEGLPRSAGASGLRCLPSVCTLVSRKPGKSKGLWVDLPEPRSHGFPTLHYGKSGQGSGSMWMGNSFHSVPQRPRLTSSSCTCSGGSSSCGRSTTEGSVPVLHSYTVEFPFFCTNRSMGSTSSVELQQSKVTESPTAA